MREIIFRGKRIDNGEWIEGNYQHFYLKSGKLIIYISDWGKVTAEVIPETVGQYTGLKDKNGTKIFEGDICSDEDSHFTIEWDEYKYGFVIKEEDNDVFEIDQAYGDIEVIGNIHDNPELLEVE